MDTEFFRRLENITGLFQRKKTSVPVLQIRRSNRDDFKIMGNSELQIRRVFEDNWGSFLLVLHKNVCRDPSSESSL